VTDEVYGDIYAVGSDWYIGWETAVFSGPVTLEMGATLIATLPTPTLISANASLTNGPGDYTVTGYLGDGTECTLTITALLPHDKTFRQVGVDEAGAPVVEYQIDTAIEIGQTTVDLQDIFDSGIDDSSVHIDETSFMLYDYNGNLSSDALIDLPVTMIQ
jgi:hypothetical protein